jgi:hypothetical protein
MNRSAQERAPSAASLDFRRLFRGRSRPVPRALRRIPTSRYWQPTIAWLRATRTERDAIVGRGPLRSRSAEPGRSPCGGTPARVPRTASCRKHTSEAMPVQKHAIRDTESGGVDEALLAGRELDRGIGHRRDSVPHPLPRGCNGPVRASRRHERELERPGASWKASPTRCPMTCARRCALSTVSSRILEEDYGNSWMAKACGCFRWYAKAAREWAPDGGGAGVLAAGTQAHVPRRHRHVAHGPGSVPGRLRGRPAEAGAAPATAAAASPRRRAADEGSVGRTCSPMPSSSAARGSARKSK